MKKLELNDALMERLEVIAFNLNTSLPEALDRLMEVYWGVLKGGAEFVLTPNNIEICLTEEEIKKMLSSLLLKDPNSDHWVKISVDVEENVDNVDEGFPCDFTWEVESED